MKNKRIKTMILTSLALGLLTAFTVQANALEFSVQFGSRPPRPPARRFHAPPEPVYVEYYNDAVLNLGSSYFSLDYPVVYAYSRDYNLSPNEVIYILYLSHYSHRSPIFVISVYQKYHNRGWSVMAKKLGLSRGYPRWMSDRNAPLLSVLYITSDYYDVPYTQVRGIYNQGYQPAEIVIAVNISSQSGQPVNGILLERNKGTTWENIAVQNKTSFDAGKSPHAQGKSVKFNAPLQENGPPLSAGQMNKPNAGNQGPQGNKQGKVQSNQGTNGQGQNQDQGKVKGKKDKNTSEDNGNNKDNGKHKGEDKGND